MLDLESRAGARGGTTIRPSHALVARSMTDARSPDMTFRHSVRLKEMPELVTKPGHARLATSYVVGRGVGLGGVPTFTGTQTFESLPVTDEWA